MLNSILCPTSDVDGIRKMLAEPGDSDGRQTNPVANAGLRMSSLGKLTLIRFETRFAVSTWFSRRIAWNTPEAMMYESTDGKKVFDHIREKFIENEDIVLFEKDSKDVWRYREHLDEAEAIEMMAQDFTHEEKLIDEGAIPVDDEEL